MSYDCPPDYQQLLNDFREATPLAQQNDLMMDGPLSWKRWELEPVKILFYLQETYGYADSARHISEDYEGWIRVRILTVTKILTTAWSILEQIEGREVSDAGIWRAFRDFETLSSVVPRIAHVNVRKVSSNSSAANGKIVRDASRQHAGLLRRQIVLTNADIIVCGGTLAWCSLVHDLGFSPDEERKKKPKVVARNGKLLCHFNHPSRLPVRTTLLDYSARVAREWTREQRLG